MSASPDFRPTRVTRRTAETEFEVVERVQYNKKELPLERIFAKSGDPVLTLITCGGGFNQSLRSYDDNFVVYAVPVEA